MSENMHNEFFSKWNLVNWEKSSTFALAFKKVIYSQWLQNGKYRGVEQLVARQAHNLEVTCSSHVSATITLGSPLYSGFPSVCNKKVGRISDDVSGHIGCVSELCKSMSTLENL